MTRQSLAQPPLPPARNGRVTAARSAALLTSVPPCATAAEKAALAEVSAAYGAVLADLQFSFVICCARSPDLPIVYASSNFFSCTGYSPQEVLGRNCRFLQGPATSHQSVMQIRDAIREERPVSVCLLNYRKDKTPFWNAFRLEPVKAACGMTQWFVGLQADATRLVESGGGDPLAAYTEQEEASAAAVAARLEAHARELAEVDRTQKCAVLESIPSSLLTALSRVQDCFCLSDPNLPDCPIVYASPAFLRLTGYPCSEVVGRNCRFLQGPGTDPATVDQLRQALSADPPRPVTVALLNYKRANNSGYQEPFWNSLHIAPLRDADGKVQFYVGVQMAIQAGDGEELSEGDDVPVPAPDVMADRAVNGAPAPPAADPLLLLRQKGVVGSLRVATRALAVHGLRRERQFQRPPSRAG